MAAISIRDLPDDVHRRLRIRAAEHGRSMEAEARAILSDAVDGETAPAKNIGVLLYEAFQSVGGVDLKLTQDGRGG